jgi:pyruvate, orthophosphate dikinase
LVLGEGVVAGVRNTLPLSRLAEIDEVRYDELLGSMTVLEEHYRDMCDIEFTVEDGVFADAAAQVGKRTAQAAFRVAHAMVTQGTHHPLRRPQRVSPETG